MAAKRIQIAALVLLSACSVQKKGQEPTRPLAPVMGDPHVNLETKLEAIGCRLDAITTETVHHTLGGTNPPHVINDIMYFALDGLYWIASEDGLGYASETNGDKVHRKEPHFKWNPGFRFGMGFYFGHHDYWDLFLNYTYFQDRAHASVSGGEAITTSWYPARLGGTASRASSHWKLFYNTLDAELGRNYFISQTIALRPHIGLRGAWIDQRYRAIYRSAEFNFINAFGTAESLTQSTAFKAQNDFQGVGLRAGANFLWHFDCHWGIVGQIAGALVYGRFDIDEKINGAVLVASGTGAVLTPANIKIREDYQRVRANLEGSLGIQWERIYPRSGNHLAFALCYEITQWFKQNQLVQTVVAADSAPLGNGAFANNSFTNTIEQGGDLGLQGVTFKIRLDF